MEKDHENSWTLSPVKENCELDCIYKMVPMKDSPERPPDVEAHSVEPEECRQEEEVR